MVQYRLIDTLLLPSLLSGATVVCLSLALLVGSGVTYVTENQLFYDYLFGAQGINTILLRAPDNSSAVWNAVLNSAFVYYILLIMAAVITGLTIFAILRGITKITASVHSFKEARLEQKQAIQEMFQRLTVRILAFMAATLYWIFFASILMPFDILLLQTGVDTLDAGQVGEGIAYGAASYLLMVVSLHLHVVFARLCMLRPRLFGGYDAQMSAINE